MGAWLILLLSWFACAAFGAKAPLHVPLAAPQVSLTPIAIQDKSSLWVSRQVNCQLVRFDRGQLKLEAAEKVDYVDPKHIRILISKKAKFHDGKPVTADDVLASLSFVRDSRKVLRNIFDWIDSMKAADSRTVDIRLNQKVPAFLRVFSSPNYAIFSEEFLKKARKDPSLWEKPMGCGQYKVEKTTAKAVTLAPISPASRPIVFHLSDANAVSKAEMNKYDIVGMSLKNGTPSEKEFRLVKLFDPYHIFMGLNTTVEPWTKKENRCALFKALDRSGVLKAYGEEGEAANDILPRGVLGFDPRVNFSDSLKQTDYGPAPTLSHPFKLSMLSVSIAEPYREAFVGMIKKLYPQTDATVIFNPKHYGSRFLDSKSDGMILGLKSNYLDGYEYLLLFKEKDANFTGYWDNKLNTRIEQSQSVEDVNARASVYRSIARDVRDECLLYPIVTIPMKHVYVRRGLKTPGIGTTALNDYFLGEVE